MTWFRATAGALTFLFAVLPVGVFFADGPDSLWTGVWTYDLCHEDRKPGHDKETFCREGKDRIEVTRTPGGGHDITLCPANPWGERDVAIGDAGRSLSFRTRDGLMVRLVLGEDGGHYRGQFRSTDGHSGRVWGRRVDGCL